MYLQYQVRLPSGCFTLPLGSKALGCDLQGSLFPSPASSTARSYLQFHKWFPSPKRTVTATPPLPLAWLILFYSLRLFAGVTSSGKSSLVTPSFIAPTSAPNEAISPSGNCPHFFPPQLVPWKGLCFIYFCISNYKSGPRKQVPHQCLLSSVNFLFLLLSLIFHGRKGEDWWEMIKFRKAVERGWFRAMIFKLDHPQRALEEIINNDDSQD